MTKRVFSLLLAAILAGLCGPAFSDAALTSLAGFVGESPLPDGARERLTARVAAGPEATAWIIEEDGVVYSLVFLPAPDEDDPQARRKMESSLLAAAEMKGKMNLLLYGAASLYPSDVYAYPEAIAGALISLKDERSASGIVLPGSQSSRKILDGGVASLDWAPLEKIEIAGRSLPSGKAFDDAYCAQLYGISRSFFTTGQYARALGILKEMHRFQWMNPDAYLDTAECFIRLDRPEDGRVMLERTLEAMGDKFSVEQLERAGELFGEAGDEASMQRLFEEALRLFRSWREGEL